MSLLRLHLARLPPETRPATYLLWAPPIRDLLGVLRLFAVLPRQVDNKGAVVFVLAHVHCLDLVLPAAARRLPLNGLGAGGRRRVERVAVLLLGALGVARCGGAGLAAALAARERRPGLLEEILLAANRRVVCVQSLAGVLAVG